MSHKGNRELSNAERFAPAGLFGSSEKKRDQRQAKRDIEGLNQNDQMIALLSDLLAEQRATNGMLRWLCDRQAARQSPE